MRSERGLFGHKRDLQRSPEPLQPDSNLTDPLSALAKGIAFTAERFRDNRDGLREIADAMSLPVVVCNRDLTYRWVSQAYARWVDREVDQVIGRSFAEVLGDGACEALRPYWDLVLQGESVEYEERVLLAAGPRWIHAVYAPTFGHDGRPDGWVAMVLDVDEQQANRERLWESETRFRRLANSVPVLVWMRDTEGRLTFVNARYVEFTGHPEAEIRRNWQALIHPEDLTDFSTRYAAAVSDAEEWRSLLRLRRHDGVYRWFETIGVPRYEGERLVGYTGVSFDVTDRKESEEAALEDNRRKDEFISVLGHELRNPLAALSNAVGVLEKIEADNPTAIRATGIARRQIGHLTRLLDDLLDLGRVMSGKIKLSCRPVDLGEIVVNVTRLAEASGECQSRRIDVAARPAWISGDPTRLQQIVNNLFDNALKFTPVRGEIGVSVSAESGRARLVVSDSGIGISTDFIPKLFEPFAQAKPEFGAQPGGLGLGLALTKRLVELHGGEIQVESDGLGRGATFTATFPLVSESRAHETAGIQARECLESLRILVVEDNDDNRETVRALLEMSGHIVTCAADGPEAVEAALEFSPEVALIDLALPTWDGYEVARRLRVKLGSPARLIALSGFGRETDKAAAREAGFDAFLVKPVDPSNLMKALYSADR